MTTPEDEWEHYETGPYCLHWVVAWTCEKPCARCGQPCFKHGTGYPDDVCETFIYAPTTRPPDPVPDYLLK